MSPVSLIRHNERRMRPGVKMESEAMHYCPVTTLRLSINSFQGLPVNRSHWTIWILFIHMFFFPCVWDWWHLMTLWWEIGNEWDRSQQTVYWGIDGHQSGNVRMWANVVQCHNYFNARARIGQNEPTMTSDWPMYNCWWEQIASKKVTSVIQKCK